MTTSDVERQFAYRMRWSTIAFGAALFGVATVLLGNKANHNDRALVINGIFELTPEQATTFWKLLSACSMALTTLSVISAYLRFTSKQRIAFGATSVFVPKSRWSDDAREIAYRDVTALTEFQVSRTRILHVVHPGGTAHITSEMLASIEQYVEVRALLTERVRAAGSGDQRPI